MTVHMTILSTTPDGANPIAAVATDGQSLQLVGNLAVDQLNDADKTYLKSLLTAGGRPLDIAALFTRGRNVSLSGDFEYATVTEAAEAAKGVIDIIQGR
jgi:hypothetical protein